MSTTSHEPAESGQPLAIEICKPMMIDRFMPAFDVGKSRHRIVDAPAEETWAALRGMDFSNVPSPLIRLGLAIHRQARKRAMAARGAKRTTVPRRLTFENLEDYGRIKLAEQPGFEIVVGAVAELGRPRVPETIAVEDFVSLERPGYVKGVGSFSVRPYGVGRSIVSYETRASASDSITRRRLRRTWHLLEPLLTLTMDSVLIHIGHIAQRRARRDHAEAA